MTKTNRKQREAIYKVWQRDNNGMSYLTFRRSVQPQLCGDDSVMVHWCNMWLGIETDGYTHS